ncbi:hypothetical protein, partial [Arthrobacter sp. B1805]|uniref:hypothetical protein n=1 Tax=Arthrobacter sp. B1805 TaxID=2058892 RepID=UPI001CA4E1D4
TSKFNQSKNNRYQQTWHTIEFSNNRSYRHQTQPNRHVIAPKQLFKLTRTNPIPQIRSQQHHQAKPGTTANQQTHTTDNKQEANSNTCTAHVRTTSTL